MAIHVLNPQSWISLGRGPLNLRAIGGPARVLAASAPPDASITSSTSYGDYAPAGDVLTLRASASIYAIAASTALTEIYAEPSTGGSADIYGTLRRLADRAATGAGNPHFIDPATGLPMLMANPPVVTTTASLFANNAAVVAAGYSKLFAAAVGGNVNPVYYCAGGWPRISASVYLILPSGTTWSTGNGNAGNNPPLQALAPRIKFMTDSPKPVLGVTGTYRLIVNGRYVSLAPYAPSGTVPAYTLVDFTAVGGRQDRQIEIEMITATTLYGVWVGPTETVWAPPSGDNLRWIQNGDSLTVSSGNLPGGPGDGYSEIMADFLGVSDYRAAGIGATGYLANNGGVNYRMSEHMFDLLNYNPDVISLAGGVNDQASAFSLAQPGLASCIAQARAYSATMPIFVTGVLMSANVGTALAWETAQSAYIASLNDPNLFFIPIITDPNGSWITGSGNSTAPAGDGNRDFYWDNAGAHPPTVGHQYLGRRYAAAVRSAIAGR